MAKSLRGKFAVVALVLMTLTSASASETHPMEMPENFWNSVEDLVLRCSVLPYGVRSDGGRIYGQLRSNCPDRLKVMALNPLHAWFQVDDETFTAHVVPSEHSDGGDLFDVFVTHESTGKTIASRHAVPAYGDPLLALAGGDLPFVEIHDPLLNLKL